MSLLRRGVIDCWPYEYLYPRRTFTEETAQVPHHAWSTQRLRAALLAAAIGSGRAAAEAAPLFGVSWWLVHRIPRL
ncbi:hypothetical protein G9E11_15085 [Arthrobacter sp. IA7]|uniref:hypothetical protein n=1 Tax=Arthrobacter ipis TaxID=2716202 RepID=UPI0016853F0B|nr:hypothetical protein [Arthrobacter ipis]MBD1543537.1 hypothetical protein [Arthrobacter ipis]